MEKAQCIKLLQEFALDYPNSPEGRRHIKFYNEQRQQGRRNFSEIIAAHQQGQDITNDVLLKLLPHTNTIIHQENGAWIHIAPCITGDIKSWYESSGWTKSEDWQNIAQSIFDFISRCNNHPEQLSEACTEFSNLLYNKGLQTGMMTPILNALNSDRFLLINNKSRKLINELTGTIYSQKITDYPAANQTGKQLIQELTPELQSTGISELRVDDIFDMFSHWVISIKKNNFLNTHYWKISPGENALQWDEFLEQGIIGIGWNEIGDISQLSRTEFDGRRDSSIAAHPEWQWTKASVNQVWVFSQIKVGDRIIANRGTTEVLGIGTVVGDYYFESESQYSHQLPVKWDDITSRNVNERGWRKTLIGIDLEKFNQIIDSSRATNVFPIDSSHPFTTKTFDLLAALQTEPKVSVYNSQKIDFQQYLIKPFQGLMRQVAQGLPQKISDRMETQKYIFSQIPKNDYGQGNAWDFYWGAFYPKGCKRTESAQLYLWINHERIEFGFFVGVYGKEQRERFQDNCKKYSEKIISLLSDSLINTNIFFGSRQQFNNGVEQECQLRSQQDFAAALSNLTAIEVNIAQILKKEQILNLSQEQLVKLIIEAYQKVFPFVLLAFEEDPIPKIQEYLHLGSNKSTSSEVPKPAPPRVCSPIYTLSECANDLNISESILTSYLQALNRKKQAILYGSPGTGKTFMAKKLAQLLLSEGAGFSEVVQFHPAYSYEDFIQGIRPQKVNGSLDYPIVPGRFLSFCNKAKMLSPTETCVLIIDEINRANLAQVFGELMYLLEYRDEKINLAAGEIFSIPSNVLIIGTMNTADRSIALVDHALRRRFAFLHIAPNYELLRQYHQKTQYPIENLIKQLQRLNQSIGDRHYEIGTSFFLHQNLAEHLESIWRTEIEPYLEEYFFDRPEKVKHFHWENIRETITG
jgi:5-methylcytosine-specific restriction enzyme B